MRTSKDIDRTREILKKLKSGSPISSEDAEILERGTLTCTALNRIESKQAEISKKAIALGYYHEPIESKEWKTGDYFYAEDLRRICDNNKRLRKTFFVKGSTPTDAVAKYHFEEINKLEQILLDLQDVISDMESKYRECGTFSCGED